MLPYEQFAAVYDRIGHDQFSIEMAQYTLKILDKFKVQAVEALDLCCGTGSAIEVLHDHGIMMSGLDGSKEMLKVARKKLAGRRVSLYHQQLPKFEIKNKAGGGRTSVHRYDLVTCFFDSLNYLDGKRELKATFRAVYRHLKPGGWFVFDMNTAYMLSTVFSENKQGAGVRDDVAWVINHRPDSQAEKAELLLTLFVKEGRHWQRFDETHREQAYSNLAIKKMLRDVGFRVKGFYRCLSFEKPSPQSKRIAIAVQRPT